MKRLRTLSLVGLLAAGVLMFAGVVVKAQEVAPMSDAQVSRIRANCDQATHTLGRLHASDALLRVNRGQLYNLISTKLMARLNSRLALNRLDGSKLVSATASFDRSLSEFRTKYKAYEEQLSATLRIDCKKQPVAFYYSVARSRELRLTVHDTATELGQYIDQYNREFDDFRSTFNSSKKEEV